MQEKNFDAIIIGGSYAGLSAALALGRAIRRVLVIDSGKPCNAQTPHSHNFLTQDGTAPQEIAALARRQVMAYDTVSFAGALAVRATKTGEGFNVETDSGETFNCHRLVLATGVRDMMPALPGFAECWGISVIHCPYCHGYEYKGVTTAVLGNGDPGFDLVRLVRNWTSAITLLTNGPAAFDDRQRALLGGNNIAIIETRVRALRHDSGRLKEIVFEDGSAITAAALYARPPFEQHTDLYAQLGCELTEAGHLRVDALQRTSAAGVFACGDNATPVRSVSYAVAAGTMAGVAVNKELIEERFAAGGDGQGPG